MSISPCGKRRERLTSLTFCSGYENTQGRPAQRHGLAVWQETRLTCVLLFCEVAELVEPLGRALAQDIGRLGAGLGR
jgi:hypothetical protein